MSHASSTDEGVSPSLAAFLNETADAMEAIAAGAPETHRKVQDGRLIWNS
ncbi:hypothetical protein [Streptomyces sp. NPDC020362]